MRVLGIDISGYQRRPPGGWFRRRYEDGHRVFISQLWGGQPGGGLGPNEDAAYQLEQAAAAGFPILGGYIYLPPDAVIETHELVRVAREAAAGMANLLSFVAIDVEADRPLHHTQPAARFLDCHSNVSRLFPNARVVVYTRRNIWAVNVGTENPWPDGAPRAPLWEARYVVLSGQAPQAPPDLDWQWQPFGGWAERAGLQYAGTVPLDGVGADLNVFDLVRLGIDSLSGDIGEEEIDVSQLADILARLGALESRVAALEARLQAPPPPSPRQMTFPEDVLARGVWGIWEAVGRPGNFPDFLARFIALNPNVPRDGAGNPILHAGQAYNIP